MIISASRRSDIPAFYSRWWMNRVRAGFVLVPHPFNTRQVRRIDLRPAAVDAIVFWTRHAAPLLPHLAELDDLGYAYYFQYTLTSYPRALEVHTPAMDQALTSFRALSTRIGPARVIWRYDPILLCNLLTVTDHLQQFARIAAALAGYTRQVVISFADLYGKAVRQLDKVPGLAYVDILTCPDQLATLLDGICQIAARYDLAVSSCAEALDLDAWGIRHGRCIDADLLASACGRRVSAAKDPGQRPACGCARSVDIGQYDTCPHGCTYCYANRSQALAARHLAAHDPESPLLYGPPATLDPA